MNHFTGRTRALLAGLQTLVWTGVAFAQQSTADVTTTTTTTSVTWYAHWWVWAVAVATFLIVVIALTNRGGRSNA